MNVLAFSIIALTAIPVALAQRLMRDTGVLRRGSAMAAAVQGGEVTTV